MNDFITKIDNFIAPVAERGGFRLARVGGSVRDEILGRRVKDADYVAFGVTLQELGEHLTALRDAHAYVSVTPLKLRDGRQAGWRVFKKGYGLVEIMLPRTEVSTGTGHGDFEIVLDPSLTTAEDALRRDFTFNALYKWIVNPDRGETFQASGDYPEGLHNVEDPLERGLYDLQHKLVNTTHPDSFRDDPLRTLRALRFVSTLGYDLGAMTQVQMIDHADAVHGLSHVYKAEADRRESKMDGERKLPDKSRVEATSGTVLAEMDKLLMGDGVAKALRLMRDTGVMGHLFPELAPMIGHQADSRYHDMTTDEHTFTALEAAAKVNASLWVRWALLFHDSGKPATGWYGKDGRKHYYETDGSNRIKPELGPVVAHERMSESLWRKFCKRANVPKGLRETVATLIREHMLTVQPRNMNTKVRRMRVRLGDELLHDLLMHRACDLMGKGKVSAASVGHIADQERVRAEAEANKVPASVKDLQINGHDVMRADDFIGGSHPMSGKFIGEVLRAVLDDVVCQPDELRLSKEWQKTAADRHVRRLISK